MIKLERKFVEKQLNKKIVSEIISLGVDPASSRTGWAISKTDNKFIYIETGFINIKSNNILDKYNVILEFLDNLIKANLKSENSRIVIEDSFFGKSIVTLKVLSRIGMIVYILAVINKIDRYFILPNQARTNIGLKASKKEVVHAEFEKKLKLGLTDPDIIDAIVLSLNGIIKSNIELDL